MFDSYDQQPLAILQPRQSHHYTNILETIKFSLKIIKLSNEYLPSIEKRSSKNTGALISWKI